MICLKILSGSTYFHIFEIHFWCCASIVLETEATVIAGKVASSGGLDGATSLSEQVPCLFNQPDKSLTFASTELDLCLHFCLSFLIVFSCSQTISQALATACEQLASSLLK